MFPYIRIAIGCLWAAAGVVWLVGALTAKRIARSQSAGSRLLHLALGLLAWLIGFSKPFGFGLLARPFVPNSPVTAYSGLALTIAGVGFAIWARLILGGNWSGRVTIKEGHTLEKRGPYAIVRHPIYSGLLLAILGTAIAFREIRGLIAVALVFAMLLMKSRMEERFMIEEFGSVYREYGRQVKALIPFVY